MPRIDEPYYDQDGVTIYHGNCLDVLPHIEHESISLLVADWPFAMKNDDVKETISLWSPLLKDPANLAMINNPHNLYRIIPELQGYIVRNGVVLPKTMAFFPAHHLGFRHNYLWLLCTNSGAYWGGNNVNHKPGMTDIWDDEHYTSGFFGHPEAIPRWLAMRIIELCSQPGDTILDVFTGTGTFLRAAKDLGRKAIGIDIEEKYCRLAAGRGAQGVLL